ncbi:hypothetical protein [Variovorax sp. KK3]|uniref:hypothetical protein n=1 Tax=Variovorax sp. KK3 TaxID=1855728 RepID=UPI00097BB039|nr:hypothetical protein [Variovorax sp. KK3]
MPTTIQKADILSKAGVAAPAFPGQQTPPRDPSATQEHAGDPARAEAVVQWEKEINELFVAYAASRAARSLREAEEAQQLSHLRHANSQLGQADIKSDGEVG